MKQFAESLQKLHPLTKQFGSNTLVLDIGEIIILTILISLLLLCVYLMFSIILEIGPYRPREYAHTRQDLHEMERYIAEVRAAQITNDEVWITVKDRMRVLFQSLTLQITPVAGAPNSGRILHKGETFAIKPILSVVVNDRDVVGKRLEIVFRLYGPKGGKHYDRVHIHILHFGDNVIKPNKILRFKSNTPTGRWKIECLVNKSFTTTQGFLVTQTPIDSALEVPRFGADMTTTAEIDQYAVSLAGVLTLDELLQED